MAKPLIHVDWFKVCVVICSAGVVACSDDQVGTALEFGSLHPCEGSEPPDPRGARLKGEPQALSYDDGVDLVLPQPVLDWMTERRWQTSHDGWHNVRRCPRGDVTTEASAPPTSDPGFQVTEPEAIMKACANPLLIPPQQECENARDGYEFLVMHRHMLHALRQAFPKQRDLFAGFPEFPFHAEDVPEEWRDRWEMSGLVRSEVGARGWDPHIVQAARRLESIGGDNDGGFASEGELGMYIQCGTLPMVGRTATAAASVHAALHYKWIVRDSPHSLGRQTANIENYMFWKLHGWIDDVWERYREAKGLERDSEDTLDLELRNQCWEMHELGHAVGTSCSLMARELPHERGEFHEEVRPILEKYCTGCHSECSPAGNVALGGAISSEEIVRNLIHRPSFSGGDFELVTPGDPMRSWLYLKISGQASDVDCNGRCLTQTMPPFGMAPSLTEVELQAVHDWIAAGAELPMEDASE